MNMKKKNEYKLPVEEYAAMVNEPQRSWADHGQKRNLMHLKNTLKLI